MLARNAVKALARRTVAAPRRFSTEKVGKVELPEEFKHFDSENAYADSPNVTGFSSWGLVVVAFQIQFLLYCGTEEEELSWVHEISRFQA